MKRSINTHNRNKLFVSLFVFILLILPNNVIAVDYVLEEDFSSGKGDWIFIGANWRNFERTGVEVINHSLSIQDGKLVSDRLINDTYNWDHAYYPTTLSNGVWEFNAQQERYTPNVSSNPYSDYHWQFELTNDDLDWDGKNSTTLIPDIILVQFRDDLFGTNKIIITEINSFNEKNGIYIRNDNFTENGVDYTFMIAKNDGKISVFINEVMIVEHELTFNFGSFNYFGVGTARPISFDNFRVTEDLSILPTSEGDRSDNGFLSTTNIVISLGTFTLLALSYKFYFSKKKSLKI